MQITKELIDNDIKGMEATVEEFKARIAQALGALTTLRNMRMHLDKEEPVAEPEEKIVQ